MDTALLHAKFWSGNAGVASELRLRWRSSVRPRRTGHDCGSSLLLLMRRMGSGLGLRVVRLAIVVVR